MRQPHQSAYTRQSKFIVISFESRKRSSQHACVATAAGMRMSDDWGCCCCLQVTSETNKKFSIYIYIFGFICRTIARNMFANTTTSCIIYRASNRYCCIHQMKCVCLRKMNFITNSSTFYEIRLKSIHTVEQGASERERERQTGVLFHFVVFLLMVMLTLLQSDCMVFIRLQRVLHKTFLPVIVTNITIIIFPHCFNFSCAPISPSDVMTEWCLHF